MREEAEYRPCPMVEVGGRRQIRDHGNDEPVAGTLPGAEYTMRLALWLGDYPGLSDDLAISSSKRLPLLWEPLRNAHLFVSGGTSLYPDAMGFEKPAIGSVAGDLASIPLRKSSLVAMRGKIDIPLPQGVYWRSLRGRS